MDVVDSAAVMDKKLARAIANVEMEIIVVLNNMFDSCICACAYACRDRNENIMRTIIGGRDNCGVNPNP